MSFLFQRNKTRSPEELVRLAAEHFASLTQEGGASGVRGKAERAVEELSKVLHQLKILLYGDSEHEAAGEEVSGILLQAAVNNHILRSLCCSLERLHFESRKDGAMVFDNLLRKKVGGSALAVSYMQENKDLLETLVEGYRGDAAMCTGNMLRECVRHEPLTKLILESKSFLSFFEFIELDTFEIAADAFSTFRELLTRHRSLVGSWLLSNYEAFFGPYVKLLESSNYVTRRQSLKLLGEVLLERENVQMMMRFISSASNLKLMMNLLRDPSRNIQIEAFHVFKVFVANPSKPPSIVDILSMNKEKLLIFLASFNPDKDNEHFAEDKAVLIQEIQNLPPPHT